MKFTHRNTTAHSQPLAAPVRSGVILLDVVAGVVLMLAAIGLVVQILAGEAAAQRAMQHKLYAMELLSNLMEEQTALPYDAVSEPSLAQLKLPPEAEELLPAALLKATLVPAEGPSQGKRLTFEITWQTEAGMPGKPVTLSAWIYPVTVEEALP